MAHGLNAPDIALSAVRLAAGIFFAASGWNKLTNPARHATITATLKADNVPFVGFMQWWVPVWEFIAGILLALGLLSAFAATVLTIICVVACCCEARKRVASYEPINAIDRVDDYLYLPEVLYIALLVTTIFVGHGKYALDTILFP